MKKSDVQYRKAVRPLTNECPRNDIKLSANEAPVMLELWGMWSTSSLTLLPGQLWLRVLEPDSVQIWVK